MDYKGWNIILASGSPRRSELLKSMNIPFEILLKSVDEDYPADLDPYSIPEFLAKKKATAYEINTSDQVFITADTLVLLENQVLGKPENPDDAKAMLEKLSGKSHTVITGVCLRDYKTLYTFSEITEVEFSNLKSEQIDHYIQVYPPMDKAGAYGIQDWIGMIGIKSIRGSYTNVMGLPTQKLYQELNSFLNIEA